TARQVPRCAVACIERDRFNAGSDRALIVARASDAGLNGYVVRRVGAVLQMEIAAGIRPHANVRRIDADETNRVCPFARVIGDSGIGETRRENVGIVAGAAAQNIVAGTADKRVAPTVAVELVYAASASESI